MLYCLSLCSGVVRAHCDDTHVSLCHTGQLLMFNWNGLAPATPVSCVCVCVCVSWLPPTSRLISGGCLDGCCPVMLTPEQWDGKSDQSVWRAVQFVWHGEDLRISHLPQLLLTTQVARHEYNIHYSLKVSFESSPYKRVIFPGDGPYSKNPIKIT